MAQTPPYQNVYICCYLVCIHFFSTFHTSPARAFLSPYQAEKFTKGGQTYCKWVGVSACVTHSNTSFWHVRVVRTESISEIFAVWTDLIFYTKKAPCHFMFVHRLYNDDFWSFASHKINSILWKTFLLIK